MPILERLYASLNEKPSWLEFALSFGDWVLRSVERDGREVAILATNGPEFHFASFGGYPFTRRDIYDEVFLPLFAAYGCAETRTPKTDTRQQRFNHRIGFQKVGEDDRYIHYRIFPKELICQ